MNNRGRKPKAESGAAYWRANGLCIDCGGEIDSPEYVRCPACRAFRVEQQKARRMAEEGKQVTLPEERKKQRPYWQKVREETVALQTQRARKERESRFRRCDTCAFATYTGSGAWFCPLAVCIYESRLEVDDG